MDSPPQDLHTEHDEVILATAPASDLTELDTRIEQVLRESLAANTWRAYAADWRAWSTWAASYELAVMPAVPVDLARYLVDQAQHRAIGTLTRRLSAISKAHVLAGHADLLAVPPCRPGRAAVPPGRPPRSARLARRGPARPPRPDLLRRGPGRPGAARRRRRPARAVRRYRH